MFDDQQLRCLRVLLDAIIPPDDYPGAWDAGVGEYLMRQLRGDLAESLPHYLSFLRGLDAEAQTLFGESFASLDLARRTSLLSKIENNELAGFGTIEPAVFFRQIVEHCAEGYYSDPGNGGNRDGAAWDMIGFEARA